VKFRLPWDSSQQKRGGPHPGLHRFDWQEDDQRASIHLRLDTNGSGLLLINANRALHLNPTAAFMAWEVLNQQHPAKAVAAIRRRFHIDKESAQADYKNFQMQLEALIRPDGPCPIHDMQLDILPPFSQIPDAPYRMDLALTYRCNCHCAHCYNARSRTYPEMSTAAWREVLDRCWEVGIPHICFTGGEATLRDDLPELIAHAQSLGQITGLLTNGRRLANAAYLDQLLLAGLDHVQITLETHDQELHDQMVGAKGAWEQTVRGIENCVASGLYVMTNSTLLRQNAPGIDQTLDFLAELGVPTIGCNALIYAGSGENVGTGLEESELSPLLDLVRARTEAHNQRLIWYTPTQYCHFDPMQLELGVKSCTAARYNMCIEPDGAVIPCQSYYSQLGNMRSDPWESIWNHELALWLRERRYLPEECKGCAMLQECGGGCPLSLKHQKPKQENALYQLTLS